MIRDDEEDELYFLPKDIYNQRQRARQDKLAGYTSSQWFIKHLEERGLPHRKKLDEENRLKSAV